MDVQRALAECWNPLRVYRPAHKGPTDEYDFYAPKILDLLYRGAGDREIAEWLRFIEINRMRLDPRPVADLVPVARKIRACLERGLREETAKGRK